ncbi:hypothetical protein ABE85_12560 [Mitsuaria sp. 7]|nr:hypothetical protein ABE85_12560 [Mitsuaria sp. 7]
MDPRRGASSVSLHLLIEDALEYTGLIKVMQWPCIRRVQPLGASRAYSQQMQFSSRRTVFDSTHAIQHA